jgi:hypothetical protein
VRPRLVPLAGGVVGLVLGLGVVVGTALEAWVLVAAASSVLGAAILLVQVDTWRRTRSLRNFVRDQLRRGVPGTGVPAAPAPAPAVTQEDVIGAVRMMQAQYTGRLDRMQRSLEEALSQLASQRRGPDGS